MKHKKKLLDNLPPIKLNDIISSIKIHKKEQEIKKLASKNKHINFNLHKESY